jgi:hypothetical protein
LAVVAAIKMVMTETTMYSLMAAVAIFMAAKEMMFWKRQVHITTIMVELVLTISNVHLVLMTQ